MMRPLYACMSMLYLNRKLHIVHTESSGGWGGQDMRVLAESIGLLERGHRVTIVTAARHRLHQEARRHGVPAVDLPLRKTLHRDNGIALEHMTSVPTGVDLARFMPRSRAEARARHGLGEAPWMGILAMMSHFKGHRDLFAALAALLPAQPALRLLVI